jgi:hypothetical protein
MEELIATYKRLINTDLPAKYKSPVRFNHCFNRIILDWLFTDCWYSHLNRKNTAIGQLNLEQLELAIARMNEWIANRDLLVLDNNSSLNFRKKKLINNKQAPFSIIICCSAKKE